MKSGAEYAGRGGVGGGVWFVSLPPMLSFHIQIPFSLGGGGKGLLTGRSLTDLEIVKRRGKGLLLVTATSTNTRMSEIGAVCVVGRMGMGMG